MALWCEPIGGGDIMFFLKGQNKYHFGENVD
jgi:hypothetical protein